MKPIRIVTVEDDEAYVDVLRQMFDRQSGFELTQAYRNPISFLGELPRLECEVILLDINLPRMSGLECIRHIREFAPRARILMLTVHDDDEYVLQAFLDGADGYLLKESTPRQIVEAIQDALKGGAPMSAAVARKVIRVLGKIKPVSPEAGGESEVEKLLSKREYEILQWLAQGERYAEIAEGLFVSLDTVKTHIRNIYSKLQVRNKTEAISRLLAD